MESQFKALERGAQVVVATPGRLTDHLRRGSLKLQDLRQLLAQVFSAGAGQDLDRERKKSRSSRSGREDSVGISSMDCEVCRNDISIIFCFAVAFARMMDRMPSQCRLPHQDVLWL